MPESKQLSPQAREARNAYIRKYRKEHKDRVRAWDRAYWERKASQHAESVPDPEMAED